MAASCGCRSSRERRRSRRMRAELLEVLPYAKMQDTSVEDMHGMSRFSGAYIPRDLLRPYEMVLRVYVDRTFKRAVSSIVGAPIYEVADPLTACVGLYVPGRSGEVDWHHDGEDLVACLMLRAPEAGRLAGDGSWGWRDHDASVPSGRPAGVRRSQVEASGDAFAW